MTLIIGVLDGKAKEDGPYAFYELRQAWVEWEEFLKEELGNGSEA